MYALVLASAHRLDVLGTGQSAMYSFGFLRAELDI